MGSPKVEITRHKGEWVCSISGSDPSVYWFSHFMDEAECRSEAEWIAKRLGVEITKDEDAQPLH